jgi:poly-gamma-glutamate synthesis protein (capsule biosynthesis protein)
MKVLLAGDFCPRCRVAEAFERIDYASVLSEVCHITEQADYSIVNFECPVVTDEGKPIDKYGPNLCCSESGVKAVKYAGFNCVTLANNHFYDYGDEGVNSTLEACDKNGIEHVGGGNNLFEASQVLYKEVAGRRLAIINCCEHEFSIATESRGGSNPLNPIRQFYDIQEAQKKSDHVLVIVHGGHELFQLPSQRMVETYRFFIDAGADVVVNHHQHCFSGYELFKGKPIFYGLGNFCFDLKGNRNSIWNKGYMVIINFDNTLSFDIVPYNQCDNIASVSLVNDKSAFLQELMELNRIIRNKEYLVCELDNYYKICKDGTKIAFEPYNNRILNKLYSMNLLPSFLSKSKMEQICNMVECESHLEKTLYFLKHNN